MSRRPYGGGAHRGVPHDYDTWYDWALVYRYWNRDAAGLRNPYPREIAELLRLGTAAGMGSLELGEHLGLTERTVCRWRNRYGAAA